MITICVTLAVTLAIGQVPKEQEVAPGATINLDARKTLCWAGATPLFRLSAAQKVRGVAPARHAGSVTVFCRRAQRELLRKTSQTIFPSTTHCSRIELSRRVARKRLFSQRQKWLTTPITS
jgi:hypothetical protein